MKLLAIETSGKLCGAAISEDNNIIDKKELDNGLTHSESLMPLIKELLAKNNMKISDFDAFVCDIGPGSFTGIRIGVATAKAFVDSTSNAQYTGVSSLEALAYNVNKVGYVCSVIDCKNDNCYFALYLIENNKYLEIIEPTAASILEMFESLKDCTNKPITFVGDGVIAYKNQIINSIPNAKFVDEDLNKINTSNLALAGFNRLSNGNVLELSPLYLKKPQAQRLLEEKENNAN